MELKLEVVLSSSIKRKKPWPRFCWLGQEKESVFLLDDKRISEINMVSGRTKKRTPKLHPLLNSVVTMASSHNGTWLCGVLLSGELFLWNRDKDLLKTAAAAPEVVQAVTSGQGKAAARFSLKVSGDGMRVLLVALTGHVFLWECMDVRDLAGVRDGTVRGHWAHIQPLEDTALPSSQDKEASQHTVFVKTEAVGDACFSAFVFTSGKKLIITCLKIQWEEGHMRVGSVGYNIQWATKTYPMSHLTPPCQPVKSRGALVPVFSPDGKLLAVVLNQRQPKATQVLYVSTQNFLSVSSGLGGCGIKAMAIPCKYIRSYWVSSVSWSSCSLFLACVLKRGSLLMLARLSGLLTLTSSGCNVDFGPAQFLPLHPLVTYRPPVSAGTGDASLSSSSLSVRDVLRQRYSVTWHPRLLYLIVSDGYMATVMRVLDRPSPAVLLKALLTDTNKDLEKASQKLDKSQFHVRAWLESVSCLKLDSSLESLNPVGTCALNTADSVFSAATAGSTLPLFLQDQGTLGGTKGLLEKVQAYLDDDSDFDGPPAGSHVEEGGRLEFASMFDTLHALDTHTDTRLVTSPDSERDFVAAERKTPLLHRELRKIQSKLLTAWAFSMSLGNAVEHRARLLKHTLLCVVRFAALLHLIPSSTVHTGKKKHSGASRLLHLIKALLSFLPWDSPHSGGPCCLGLVVELSKRLVRVLLTPHPESYQTSHCQLSSQHLSTTLHILQLVSDSLDRTYRLEQRSIWSSAEKESLSQLHQLWPSDVHYVPLLQDEREKNLVPSLHQSQPVPQRPSSRLFGVWQWVYKATQQYVEELRSFEGCDGWEEEQQQLSLIVSQIQMALQATGEKLEAGPALLSYPGEHLFLCGFYAKSADAWRSQICEESNKICDRRVFQEERICLGLLYSLLTQYRLREAQELGDHMARLILHRAGHQKENKKSITADSLPCMWLPTDLHNDAACAVIQSLGRFMASYFANQPLQILPPHNVAVLPPLHLPHAPNVGRLVPLCQEEVATAVRRQHLSEVWTVDYALDLLLLGGLLPEAAWLAYRLGDWKTAVSLSLAYTSYCTDNLDFARLKRRELHIPTDLEAKSIFQAELENLLGNKPDSQENKDKDDDKSFSDPLEGEEWDLLLVSMKEILKASVMAGVNVMSSPLSSLLDTAKDLCSCLPMLVPNGLYLPSPPLYCPQPSPNTQDPIGTTGQFAEVESRHKVSGVLQRLLLLLRSARCCHPAAQWYITHLRRARHLLHKIKRKYSYPGAAEEERTFPEGLMKFVTHSGFFRRGPNKDGHLDTDAIQTIISFRELCGLCWMLHVRDHLSISCRKYQAARQHCSDEQIPADSEVRSSCVEALRWARRFLPFSNFLNAEEMLQDVLLSLVSELPPISLVADALVQAFPGEEESVRVPLREKYNSLLQRLRQCSVLDGEKDEANELMMILMQDKHRQRRKHLGRLRRHLAPPELHLWEKEEEEEDRGSKYGMAALRQLSLGTSLSTSTLTDFGFPPVCSDGDTSENTCDAISPVQHSRPRHKKKSKVRNRGYAVKIKSAIQEEIHPDETKGDEKSSLPVVGTWEFELEDDEYLNFLELFLSYELEKDGADGGDRGSELPLLKSFSSQLRRRELHSLTFDVLTTIHRRHRDGHHPGKKHWSIDPPVFRAGCCYFTQVTTPEPQTSSVWNEASISRTSLSVSSLSGLRTGRQKGLFGLRKQNAVPLAQRLKGSQYGSETSPFKSAFPIGKPSESLIAGSSTSVEDVVELQQGLDHKLEAQFPELGRLLEWMVRWADRRVLLGHHGKKKKERGGRVEGTADEGVVIRVKASAPAVLTSLSLLEWRHSALLGSDRYSAHIRVPESQWRVSPLLQPEVDRNLERESSVDTGYPGSANTPITGLDHNQQQEELSIGSCTDEPVELSCHRVPLPNNQDQPTSDAQQRQSSPQKPSLDDLDVTPEKEGKSSGSDVSFSVSHGNIPEKVCTPEASLKVEDLDFSENVEDSFSSASLSLQAPLHPEPRDLSTVQPEASVHTGVTDSVGVLFLNTPVDPPSLQPQSSMAGATTAVSTAPNHPSIIQTPPARQQLGEDLFRLVQHINYMGMMEVLGASFSSLQLAQQSSTLAQSNLNASHPHVPPSHVTNYIPQPNALPDQTTISVAPQTQSRLPTSASNNPQPSQATACMFADRPALQIAGKTSLTDGHPQITRNLSSAASGAGVNDQEMHQLSVQVETSEIQFRQSRGLIPSAQGLLVTTDVSQAAPSAPVVLPSDGSIQNDTTPHVFSLKLIQPRCPPLPQRSAPHYPPAQEPQMLCIANPATPEPHQPELKQNHQVASKRAEERRVGSSRRQLSFNHAHDPAPTNSRPQIQTSDRSRGQEFTSLPPASPAHTPAPVRGCYLLHLQPAAHSSLLLPKLPIPFSSRPSAVIAAPMRQTPLAKLLHLQSAPKMILPRAAPLAPQMGRLNSVYELTSTVMNVEEAQRLLLRVDATTEGSRANDTSPRQRRREEKAGRARKTVVTFTPNESIIPTLTDDSVNGESAVEEEITPKHDFALPLGSFDSLMTGQRLLHKAESTSAELHAFASTCKKPPECHDAFTNTEPACPPTLLDKAVSASVTTSIPKSKCSRNFQICDELLVQDLEETPKKPEKILHGHQFISVLDLDDNALHHDLPLCLSPGEQDTPSIRPPSPTSAQLHVLATSVISVAASAADPQPSKSITDNRLEPTTHPDSPEDSRLLSCTESNKDPERITPQELTDPSDSLICRAIKKQSVGPHRASFSPPTVEFSSRLSELDAQLAELHKIANNLEMDFSNTRMLVNTIEKLTPVLAPDVKKKNVRLSVPREAWTPRSDFSTEPKACEVEEESQDDRYLLHSDFRAQEGNSSFSYFTPHRHRAGPSYLQSPPNMKDNSPDASGISHVWEDDNLGQTGLSDTAEILDELIKEGYLSPTDLDLSSSLTAHHSSRLHHQQSSWVSHESVHPEDKRGELRIWMRRKHRERLAVYQKNRESLKEREHKPFPGKMKSTNRNRASAWRTREEKEKFMLLENYNERTREACTLASDFTTTPPVLHSSSQPAGPALPATTRSTSAPPPGSTHRAYSASAKDKILKSQSRQTQPLLRPWTAEGQGRPLQGHGRRLGLHRPVTSLPRDRLSQVTRRGMLTYTKSNNKLHPTSQSEDRRVGYQRRMPLNKRPLGVTSVGRGIQREQTKREDGEEETLWEPTSELNRLLGQEDADIVLAGLLDEQDGGGGAGVSGLDWLDDLSVSGGSSLSKIDWAAIERIVAAEED
ncbi:ciliogenesis and planar polarity effector 1 isoform X1 [Scophthalmus maximus]|uniref:ciliogenesis and planar polarity effector 1 isoform X1 n=2 Tax=Scophthalmus maximus TaxID=52904 RepID=UPI001FA8C317|nr:ciliogenesis and planar polarity effector 1 isoform X1 [Scophthalmus maximus]